MVAAVSSSLHEMILATSCSDKFSLLKAFTTLAQDPESISSLGSSDTRKGEFCKAFTLILRSIIKLQMLKRFSQIFRRSNNSQQQKKKKISIKRVIVYTFFGSMALLVYARHGNSDIQFTFSPIDKNLQTIRQVKQLRKGKYQSTFFLQVGLLQYLYYLYLDPKPYVRFEQQKINSSQTLKWIPVHNQFEEKPNMSILVVFTGTDGLDSTIQRASITAYSQGFRTVVYEGKQWHKQEQIDNVVKYIHSKYSEAKIFGLGIEYGANLMVKYAAKNKGIFAALVSIGNPLDLQTSENNFRGLWKYFLESRMKNSRLAEAKFETQKIKSLYEVDKYLYNLKDEQITSFKQRNSSINYIRDLTCECLFINSITDPFSMPAMIEDERIQNENCIFIRTNQGGHVEWYESSRTTRWVFRPAIQYLRYLDGR